ncbi:MAG: hypothetical protein LW826_00890 [Candidatus Jidaibacter sp.]|nr:hypothetical protein [Candidatus Jidaibacter sp.]
MIQRIYQNQYVKYVQIAAPSAIRLGLNYYTGQALSTGLIMPVIMGAISFSQMPVTIHDHRRKRGITNRLHII